MKHRLIHLDCLRALAALLVCVEHIRDFIFPEYAQLPHPGVFCRAFYFLTGLGQQAVLAFFVLSGFLVGGSVVAARQNGKWSWTSYALRRLTRLWVVLLPALLLTLLWDACGQHQAPAPYHGACQEAYRSGPSLDAPDDLRPATFLGNSFFLQTICVNVYGTNGPLWSLAYEFWYYLLFPLLLGIWLARKWPGRFLCAGLAAGTLLMLPWVIPFEGLVWLFGVGAFLMTQNPAICRWTRHPLWLAGTGLFTFVVSAYYRSGYSSVTGDLLMGGGFALVVAGLATLPPVSGIYSRCAAGGAEISYTLYLVHFPMLAFFFFTVFKGRKFPPGLNGDLLFIAALLAVVGYSCLVWWCFERNTDRIRKKLEQLLPGRQPAS